MIVAATTIRSFRGNHAFLSNFFPSRFCIDGKWYETNEHWFQSNKACNEAGHERVRLAPTAVAAKKIGHFIKIRADWNRIKDDVMLKGLKAKFAIPDLREKLLATGDAAIEEANSWNDKIWGVDINTGKGENRLGKMLVTIRDELLKNE
jgi:ribA/ribD-fused uncharacterized protein